MSATEKRAALADRIQRRELVTAPGIFDMMSVRIADRQQHAALYMTGYGTVASYLGLPDAGLASYTDMVHRAGMMAAGSNTPIIADADTGYGGLLNVQHTVRGYESAGIAAIQIEDQEFPKKCGHTLGRRVIDTADMVNKIRVAVDARDDPNFLIIARTDARTALGLEEAISRALAYHEAGADVLFVESPESEEEFSAVAEAIDAPLLANMADGGRSPILSREQLVALGFSVAIYPGTGFMAAAAAMEQAYLHILDTGSSRGLNVPLLSIDDMHELMGFNEVWEFENKWGR
jgi:2-methylisocitrate lyase-like PEP mutase family enzyme